MGLACAEDWCGACTANNTCSDRRDPPCHLTTQAFKSLTLHNLLTIPFSFDETWQ